MAIRTLLGFLLLGILCALGGTVIFLFLGTWL